MACYHPLSAIQPPKRYPGDKQPLKFLHGYDGLNKELPPGYTFLKVPCGQCLGCRLEYSRQWAVRCALEAKQWKHNYFVTLTYADEFLPLSTFERIDTETGEYFCDTVPVLQPDDLSAFMKRLRSNFKYDYHIDNIRFYGCGEYGSQNERPHYHVILFNCPIPDLKFLYNKDGYTYYTSEYLEKAWSREVDGVRYKIGIVCVTEFTFETAAYVARYMLKKHKGKDASYYEENGLVPEFTRCSRRPGIAHDYYEQNAGAIYDFDQVVVSSGKGKPIKCHPPVYFDRLFDIDNPEEFVMIKERRKKTAEESMARQLGNTDLPVAMYLEVKEANKSLSVSKLKRSL